jgi:CheY-like chemotaxis protein
VRHKDGLGRSNIMTAQMRAALRAVVLPASEPPPAHDTPTRRLLGELGHDVTRAASPDHALKLMTSDHTDLLVVDISNSNNRELLDSLEDLPESKRPDQVAVFSDTGDVSLRELQEKAAPSHVHVFLKPLHMHGLLGVLRQLERRKTAPDA